MRTTILVWSAVSGLVLGLIAGVMAFAVLVIGSELLSGYVPYVPRLSGRTRLVAALISFVVLPLASAVIGLLEGRLKLR